jgi:hypothetical protein
MSEASPCSPSNLAMGLRKVSSQARETQETAYLARISSSVFPVSVSEDRRLCAKTPENPHEHNDSHRKAEAMIPGVTSRKTCLRASRLVACLWV